MKNPVTVPVESNKLDSGEKIFAITRLGGALVDFQHLFAKPD